MRRRANGFKRLMAMLIDIVPIWLASLVLYKVVTGNSPIQEDPWTEITAGQLLIRDSWLLVWIPYCIIAEMTPVRGTLGKKVMGLVVMGATGRPLTFGQAFVRNMTKILSAIPCWLGFIWALFSKSSSAWHDSISGAGVFERR
ncbi:MAG: RDD family protein [Verrucomicrobiota bacterium]